MKTIHRYIIGALGLIAFAGFAFTASAFHSPEHYSLFGGAEYDSPGENSPRAVDLTSDATTAFSGVDFGVEDGVTFADLEELSTSYMFETDDSCMGGSPRFQIAVDTDDDGTSDGNIFAYIGPEPNYTNCPAGTWEDSGDLLESGKTVDTSQLGGTFYDPYDNAVATYGDAEVLGIQLVADAAWAANDGEQTVDVDNTVINDTTFTYDVATTKDECKQGGWQDLTDDEGNEFKNQGDCVSFVATGGMNKGAK